MLLMIFRLLAVAAASAMVGVASVMLAVVFLKRKRRVDIPVTAKHIVMVAVAVAGPMVSEVVDVIRDVNLGTPFYWYGSPLLFVSGAVGTYGLLKLMYFLSPS